MSFKARIRNKANQKGIPAQVLLQNHMFDCFLDKLAHSEYRDNFVIKGGVLLASKLGLDTRSTMDLDATVCSFPLSTDNILLAITAICRVHTEFSSGVHMSLLAVVPIREEDQYGGLRVSMAASFEKIYVPFSIDISTGDVITPAPVKYRHRCVFDDAQEIEFWAYNIETVLAEKLETILSRGTLNTRPRDFYDMYVVYATQPIDMDILRKAFIATAEHRGTLRLITGSERMLMSISSSYELEVMWEKYRSQFDYAREISFGEIVGALNELYSRLGIKTC